MAYRIWLKLAENGDAQAQFDLGVMFHNGLGLDKNYEKALFWFDSSAFQSHADAENYLGSIYKTGNGAKQDIEKALVYLKRAMEHGNENARVSYSELLTYGLPNEHEND